MELTRRDAMKLGAVGLASTALVGCKTTPTSSSIPAGDIDAHAHIWSDDLDAYPLGPWATPAAMKPPTFTDTEFLNLMHAKGVTRSVLIQHAPLHGYDNSYILDCARKHQGVFSVVAMINERTPHLKERLRDLRDQGARGIRIGPGKHADRTLNVDPPNWLKATGMKLLWTHAAELGVAICPLIGASWLASLAPMCEQHPGTTVVIDHFAHIDMAQPDTVAALTNLAKFKNVNVKVSGFYKFGDKKAPYRDLAPMIRAMLEAFGPDRLMWASDCPYQLNNGNTYADALTLIRSEMGLSPSERGAILRGTAERVFF